MFNKRFIRFEKRKKRENLFIKKRGLSGLRRGKKVSCLLKEMEGD